MTATAPDGVDPAAGTPGPSPRDTPSSRRAAQYRRFLRAWIPGLAILVVVEVVASPIQSRPELLTLVGLTILGGIGVVVAALALGRERPGRLPILVAALLDVTGIATALVSSAGNDVAMMLPFMGAVLLVSILDERELAVAFVAQWLAGMVGATAAYGFSNLRFVPDAEPMIVSLTAAGVVTLIAYGLLWWVRDRLASAIDTAEDAEQMARRSALALEALVRGSPVPTIGFDLDGVIRTWNPAAETVFGWTADELLGRDSALLAGAEEAWRPAGVIAEVLAGQPVRGVRARWLTRAGGTVAVDVHAASLTGDDHNPVGVVVQALDETERDALRARVAGVERMEAVGQLAGGIAHDFNNLLTAVGGYAELLEADLPVGDDRRTDVGQIRLAADRGSVLVAQLLAFSHRQPLRPVPLDLNALVAGLLPMLNRLIGSAVRIQVELTAERCLVQADPGQLEQVIVNLVTNARDAMPDGGVVTIATTSSRSEGARHVTLTVSDTGVGMDPATAARVFEPFFTTKGQGRGTGLGLATVYGIVGSHDGTISVETSPGQGTSFVVRLPGAPDEADGEVDVAGTGDPALTGGSETILVVDDEPQVRRVAARILAGLGYHVLEADDAAAARHIAETEAGSIDLVLSDVLMPEIRGPALVRQLRPLRPDMRVLYMTGYASNGLSGPDSPDLDAPVLAKPFSAAELAPAVRRILDETGPLR